MGLEKMSTGHVKKPKRRKKPPDYQFTLEAFGEPNFSPSIPQVSRMEFEKLTLKVGKIEKLIKEEKVEQVSKLEDLVFPPETLDKLPTEVKRVIEGIISNFEHDFPDFCFMGIRKALNIGIDIRFKRDGKFNKLFDPNGEPYGLPKKIELTKQEKHLSSNLASKLRKEAKVFGDIALHDSRIDLKKEEVPSIFKHLRLALEHMYHE